MGIKELDLSKNNITDEGIECFLNFLAQCGRYPYEGKDSGNPEPLVLNFKNNASYNISIALAHAEEASGLRWSSNSIRRVRRSRKNDGNKDQLAPHVIVI